MVIKHLILQSVLKKPGISCNELAAEHELHPDLVSENVRHLIASEWIAESSLMSESGKALRLHPEKRAALSISYNADILMCALVNPAGKVMRYVMLHNLHKDRDDLAENIAQATRSLEAGFDGHIVGIGIADPGKINGKIIPAGSPMHRSTLTARLQEQVKLPVILENATHARAVAHYYHSPDIDPRHDNMLYMDYHDGIRFAFLTPEGMWHGQGLSAEESGRLENLAGPSAVEAKVKNMLDQGMESKLRKYDGPLLEATFIAAEKGDRLANSVLGPVISCLGQAAASLIPSFHPRVIVVGGEYQPLIRFLARELSNELQKLLPAEDALSIKVLEGAETRKQSLVGMGRMVFDKAVSDERLYLQG